MLKLSICLIFSIISVHGKGEFSVVHHPNSLIFKGHDQLHESTLKDVFSASMGFTTEHNSYWDGMYITDPFNLAEVIATVAVDGVSDIGYGKGHHFPLSTNVDESDVFDNLEKRVKEHYPEGGSKIVRVELENGLADIQKYDVFKGIKNDKPEKSRTILRSDVDEDREFLRELTLLEAMSAKIGDGVENDAIPDIYWVKMSALHPLSDLYGQNSTHFKEAKKLLNEAIINFANAFKRAYKERALISIITSDVSHTRHTRSILQAESETKTNADNDLNLAKNYSSDYPVIFNIILWFGVAMVFSLLAICIAIGTMDPGRDSIIYRMTSTRMKKDN